MSKGSVLTFQQFVGMYWCSISAAMGIALAMGTLEKLAVTHPLTLGSAYVAMFSYFFK